MFIEVMMPLFIAVIAAVMIKRLSERPFQIRAQVVESSANVYTEIAINLPIAPVSSQTEFQAIEVMGIVSHLPAGVPEAGQNNRSRMAITKDTASSMGNISQENMLWVRDLETKVLEVSAVGEVISQRESIQYDDLTDHDGNGEIWAESEVFLAVLSTGQAAVNTVEVRLTVHLVELDAADAVGLLLDRI